MLTNFVTIRLGNPGEGLEGDSKVKMFSMGEIRIIEKAIPNLRQGG